MRRYLLSTIFLTSFPFFAASAQNYVPSNDYAGAGVVVNMDVLGGGHHPAAGPGIVPTLSRPLPPVAAPARLTPPLMTPPQAAPRLAPPPMAAAPSSVPSSDPVPFSDPVPARPAPRYTSPLAPVNTAEDNASDDAPTIAAAPAPLSEDLILDKPSDTALRAPSRTATVSAPASSSGRQELASIREPLSDDSVIDITQEGVAVKSRQAAPVDEMAPVSASPVSPAEQKADPAYSTDITTMNPPALPPAISSPAMPSPVADRPGKKGDIQTAMLSPASRPVGAASSAPASSASDDNFEAYRLLFTPGSAELNSSETAILDKVVSRMKANNDLRLQVRAYANGTPETAGAARRLSLSRALKVREYLMKHDVLATRLDIRALGHGSVEMGDEVGRGNAPGDRVDVVFAQ